MTAAPPSVHLVIPCYDEAARLRVAEYAQFLRERPEIGIRFVNDGSRDDTLAVLNDLTQPFDQATVLNLETNVGKAEAVRQGFLSLADVEAEYLGFWDADLATPLDELDRFLNVLAQERYRSVIGSRILRLGSDVRRDRTRHVLGRVFATAASWMLRLPVYDTQCGAKLFRRDLTADLFGDPFVSRWFFDIELLFRIQIAAKENAGHGIYELPLSTWHDVQGSRLTSADFLHVPWELWRINRSYASALSRSQR